MIQAFLFFPSHFLMHLLSSLHLLIEQFFLLLLLCFLLLVANQIFDHVGLCHMLITLLVEHLLLLHLPDGGVVSNAAAGDAGRDGEGEGDRADV